MEKLNENYNFYYHLFLLLVEAWIVPRPLQIFRGFGKGKLFPFLFLLRHSLLALSFGHTLLATPRWVAILALIKGRFIVAQSVGKCIMAFIVGRNVGRASAACGRFGECWQRSLRCCGRWRNGSNPHTIEVLNELWWCLLCIDAQSAAPTMNYYASAARRPQCDALIFTWENYYL